MLEFLAATEYKRHIPTTTKPTPRTHSAEIFMYKAPYPAETPNVFRVILGKFVFFDWPPSYSDMTRNVAITVHRVGFTKDETRGCVRYIESLLTENSDNDLNRVWNSFGNSLGARNGPVGRHIFEAIYAGLKTALPLNDGVESPRS